MTAMTSSQIRKNAGSLDVLPNAPQLMVQSSAFFAGFAPWREIPGRPIESRKSAKFAKVSVRFTRKPWANAG